MTGLDRMAKAYGPNNKRSQSEGDGLGIYGLENTTTWYDTPEWILGKAGEKFIDSWLRRCGFYTVPKLCVENGGAAALTGELRKIVLPDIFAARGGRPRWVEVKAKSGAIHYYSEDRIRHGVDKSKWEAYLEVQSQTGIPGYLAIIQKGVWYRAPHRLVPPGREKHLVPDPCLLFAALDDLCPLRHDGSRDPYNGKELVFFYIESFCRINVAGGLPDLPIINKVDPKLAATGGVEPPFRANRPGSGQLGLFDL